MYAAISENGSPHCCSFSVLRSWLVVISVYALLLAGLELLYRTIQSRVKTNKHRWWAKPRREIPQGLWCTGRLGPRSVGRVGGCQVLAIATESLQSRLLWESTSTAPTRKTKSR
jgi:hypothetical protein